MDEPDRHALVAGWYRELGGLVTVGDLQSGAAWSPEDVAWALKDVLSILAHVFEVVGDVPQSDAAYDLHSRVMYVAHAWLVEREATEKDQRRAASPGTPTRA